MATPRPEHPKIAHSEKKRIFYLCHDELMPIAPLSPHLCLNQSIIAGRKVLSYLSKMPLNILPNGLSGRPDNLGNPNGGQVLKPKPLISVVDDDESMREAIRGLMKSLGYTAEAFSSAEEFLNSRKAPRTSCLIADVQMPGMTGLELHHHLLALGQTIPTILITAYPDDSVRARALREGVVCYLSKPFDEDELLACINMSLRG